MRKQLATLSLAALASVGLVVTAGPAMAQATCTYTQGCYKTHYTAAQIASVNLTASLKAGILAKTGATNLSTLYWTAPKGDANIIAAHQLVTTALNGSAGETGFTGAVGDAFYTLVNYFQGTNTLTRDQIIAAAGVLDQYNNGLLTLPHCG